MVLFQVKFRLLFAQVAVLEAHDDHRKLAFQMAVLAVHFGFTLVILAAVALYLASAWVGWRAFENQWRVKAQV